MHLILLNLSARKRKRLISNLHILVVFLSLCCTQERLEKEKSAYDEEILLYGFTLSMMVPLEGESDVRATANSVERY